MGQFANLRSLLLGWLVLLVFAPAMVSGQQTFNLESSEDGSTLWITKTVKGRKQFLLVDATSATTKPAFDHDAVAKSLSKNLGRPVDSDLLPIDSLKKNARENLVLRCQDDFFEIVQGTSEATPIQRPFELFPQTFFFPAIPGYQGPGASIVFLNKLARPVELFWFAPDGSEVSYGVLGAGQNRSMKTYEGHVWILKVDNKPVACYQVIPDDFVRITQAALKKVGEKKIKRRLAGVSKKKRSRTEVPKQRFYRGAVSPDKKWKAKIVRHNVWLHSAADNDASKVQLTTDGTAENTFKYIGRGRRWAEKGAGNSNQEFYWSPDSKYFFAFQTKSVPEPKIRLFESSPNKQLRAKFRDLGYPKPGDELLLRKVHLFSVQDGQEISVSNEQFKNPFEIEIVGWSPDGRGLRLLYNQRGHQVKRLIEISARSGEARTIVEETSDTFIHYSDSKKSVLSLLPGNEILWTSERSGWNHLYRFDGASGELINPVTQGQWNVKGVVDVNIDDQVILFYAVGVREDQDPYHEHLCRVNFDGSGFHILTEGDGTHQVSLAFENRFFIDTYSRVDMAPVVELRDVVHGKKIMELGRGDAVKTYGRRRLPERFVAKGRDGETDIWGVIHWPKDFDPNRKYPVAEQVYAGPQDHHVPKKFSTRYHRIHQIADAGVIVVQIDGMGTAWRSKAFHDVCYKNLRDGGLPDRVEWIKAAAKKFPQMDIGRVGIYGGSAGGQTAMAALLWHNDFYKVAVADCGCHDNRMDKIWWNEQFMGWPVDQSYSENSNRDNAHLLKGKLMLMVGGLDTNVDPTSTFQVVDRLIKADKDFEFVFVPGGGHCVSQGAWAARKMRKFLKRHLKVDREVFLNNAS